MNRILIVKLSSIGDVVHSLPFLEAVRERFPHARIDWIVEEASAPILEGHPMIDRILVSRRKAWQKDWSKPSKYVSVLREATELIKAVRKYPYDLVIDLQGLFRSGALVGISRAMRKVGMTGAREFGGLFLTEPPVSVNYQQHAVDRYLEVARSLGCGFLTGKGRIPVSEYDMARMEDILRCERRADPPVIAVNPIARWETKMCDPDLIATLAARVQDELSGLVVFTGSGQDRACIEDISSRVKEKTINLAGKTSLKELACLYALSNVLITADTGPMHIAAAMGCRVVALFGPTDPLRTGPYGPGHRVIRAGLQCSPCFRRTCEDIRCMREISVDQCLETVKSMLAY